MYDQVVGDLTEEIAAVENGVDLVELGAFEGEFFAHAGDVGVVEVCAVEVVDLVNCG